MSVRIRLSLTLYRTRVPLIFCARYSCVPPLRQSVLPKSNILQIFGVCKRRLLDQVILEALAAAFAMHSEIRIRFLAGQVILASCLQRKKDSSLRQAFNRVLTQAASLMSSLVQRIMKLSGCTYNATCALRISLPSSRFAADMLVHLTPIDIGLGASAENLRTVHDLLHGLL